MQVFLYEHLTGGGLLEGDGQCAELRSLAVEGQAMCNALAADFSAVNGVQVTCLRDSRLDPWKPQCHRCLDVQTAAERNALFDIHAGKADWTVVIAPEIGGALGERCRRVTAVGGRLLGGSLATIDLASDKHVTAEHLTRAGVPVPQGIPFLLGEPWPRDFRYPAIWKPRDGAGSQGLKFIESCHEPVPHPNPRPGRLEVFHPVGHRSPHAPREGARHAKRDGFATAASVAFLCGPRERLSLPPCIQHLSRDFHYRGGSVPLAPDIAKRATDLARRAIASLPAPLGYIGVDIVLGTAQDGDDVVIEINPRLTTSYIGLRAACEQNVAAAMLAIVDGKPYKLSFVNQRIEFLANGTIGANGE